MTTTRDLHDRLFGTTANATDDAVQPHADNTTDFVKMLRHSADARQQLKGRFAAEFEQIQSDADEKK